VTSGLVVTDLDGKQTKIDVETANSYQLELEQVGAAVALLSIQR
jgi:hypothetical protein